MANTELILPRLQELSLEELRRNYRFFLQAQGLSRATVTTSCYDTFYLFRHEGHDVFWRVILSTNFEAEARTALLETLAKHSTVNPITQVSAYMSHLRRFRNYALHTSIEEQLANINNVCCQTQEKEKATRRTRSYRSSAPTLPRPTPSQVESYLSLWDTLEDYSLQEEALDKLFFQLCPTNTHIEDILLKVSTLNDFYSTHIYSTFPVAKHILEMDIDKRLKAGDRTLVGAIQKVSIKDTEKNFYSFATKYCNHHNPLAFPIYDSYVDEVLYRFMRQDHFAEFQRGDLKDYERFYNILLAFRSFYGLEKYNLKEIDKYLWQFGKKHLPKDYGKKA